MKFDPGVLSRRRLQARFMMTVIVATTMFAVVAGVVAYRLGYERAINNGRSALNGLVGAVEKTAAIGAFAGDELLLQEVIDGLARNEVVAQVDVDVDGGRLQLRSTGQQRRTPARGADVVVVRTLMSPFDRHETVGVLRIEADMDRLQADASAQATTLSLLMVGHSLLLAVALFFASSKLVSRPIEWLARELRTMQPGTSARLPMRERHRFDEIGTLVHSANVLLDASEQAMLRERQLRAEIEAMEAQYRQIFDSTSAGIFVLRRDGRLINGNPTVLKVIGSPVAHMRDLRGQDFIRTVFARPDRVLDMVRESSERGETVSADLELLQRAGAARWVHCLISVQGAEPTADAGVIEGVMYDVTERKHAESAVLHQAEHDSLTGLKNRAASEAAIDRFLRAAQASQAAVSLLYIDLDGFKKVNDQLGHKAGDEVLRVCAARMVAAVRRSSDLVGRIGGDEFVIALYNSGPADSALWQTAQALVDTLSQPVALSEGRLAQLGASIGIACFPRHGSVRRQLVYAADEAMYEVKRSGRNAYAMAMEARPNFTDSDLQLNV